MVISCLCGGCYLVGFFVAGCALHSLDLLDYVSYYKPVISTLQARVLIRHRIVTFQDCAGGLRRAARISVCRLLHSAVAPNTFLW